MTTRATRARIAQETLAILRAGDYTSTAGTPVDLRVALESARTRSVLYRPADFDDVCATRERLLAQHVKHGPATFEVVNETTLHAARRLLDAGTNRVLALNFASAKNPGGGFLNGSQAQEESLARA